MDNSIRPPLSTTNDEYPDPKSRSASSTGDGGHLLLHHHKHPSSKEENECMTDVAEMTDNSRRPNLIPETKESEVILPSSGNSVEEKSSHTSVVSPSSSRLRNEEGESLANVGERRNL